jgi:hypothetical protein
MAFPLITMIMSYGIALIFIILIEGFIFKKLLATAYLNAFIISLRANLFSTAIGAGIGIFATVPELFIIGWIILTVLFANWLKFIAQKTGYFKKLKAGLYIVCIIVGAAALYISISVRFQKIWLLFTTFSDIKITFLLLAFLVFGFIISFVSESYIIIRITKDNNSKMVPAVFKVNLVSYLVLILFTVIRVLIK